MALPDGFRWTTITTNGLDDRLTVIAYGSEWVVTLSRRVDDGTWIASLDRHRHGPGGPFRRCSSYEQGCAGAEMWVARHEARLREDMAKIAAWRETVRGNRLNKGRGPPPFDGIE